MSGLFDSTRKASPQSPFHIALWPPLLVWQHPENTHSWILIEKRWKWDDDFVIYYSYFNSATLQFRMEICHAAIGVDREIINGLNRPRFLVDINLCQIDSSDCIDHGGSNVNWHEWDRSRFPNCKNKLTHTPRLSGLQTHLKTFQVIYKKILFSLFKLQKTADSVLKRQFKNL